MDDRFFLDEEFDADIDLTPLIDVVFMLLIFFFMATTFLKPVVEVNLARAASAVSTSERPEQTLITITRDGLIYHDEVLLSREDLPAFMGDLPDARINLYVDQDAPFEAFMAVLDQARLNGREDLAITTLPKEND
jgi:biopolymer transport protein ExbD